MNASIVLEQLDQLYRIVDRAELNKRPEDFADLRIKAGKIKALVLDLQEVTVSIPVSIHCSHAIASE